MINSEEKQAQRNEIEQLARDGYTKFVDEHNKHLDFRVYIDSTAFGGFERLKTERFAAECGEHLHSYLGHSVTWANDSTRRLRMR
jgi:hypothetical protein